MISFILKHVLLQKKYSVRPLEHFVRHLGQVSVIWDKLRFFEKNDRRLNFMKTMKSMIKTSTHYITTCIYFPNELRSHQYVHNVSGNIAISTCMFLNCPSFGTHTLLLSHVNIKVPLGENSAFMLHGCRSESP